MKKAPKNPESGRKREPKSDPAASYDEFKEFEGQRYTGMAVGRGHKWNYDAGVWKDRKITPDLWEISYAVTKRRAGRAPEGSGAPVDTEYHWYILAHQKVRKLNANDYTTSMAGLKFKVAHKRGGTDKWSVSDKGQKKRIIKFLRDVLADLEAQEEEATGAPRKKTAASAGKKAAASGGEKMAASAGKKTAARVGAKPAEPDRSVKARARTPPKSMRAPSRPKRKAGA